MLFGKCKYKSKIYKTEVYNTTLLFIIILWQKQKYFENSKRI